jgi:hypothetical protein
MDREEKKLVKEMQKYAKEVGTSTLSADVHQILALLNHT